MPGSMKHGKEEIKKFVYQQDDIKTIVDIGVGSGTYRTLLGDKYKWIGIEIFPKYIEMFDLKKLYDQVIIGNVFDIDLPYGDLIIFGDVLEHLEKDKAIQVLKDALIVYKHVIVSIPIGEWVAKEHYGNKYELHLSTWEFEELKKMANWEIATQIRSIGVFCK